MRDFIEDFWPLGLILGVLLVGIVWLMVAETSEQEAFKRYCGDAGGHIYQPDESAWCLTTDGRFIEVYP